MELEKLLLNFLVQHDNIAESVDGTDKYGAYFVWTSKLFRKVKPCRKCQDNLGPYFLYLFIYFWSNNSIFHFLLDVTHSIMKSFPLLWQSNEVLLDCFTSYGHTNYTWFDSTQCSLYLINQSASDKSLEISYCKISKLLYVGIIS